MLANLLWLPSNSPWRPVRASVYRLQALCLSLGGVNSPMCICMCVCVLDFRLFWKLVAFFRFDKISILSTHHFSLCTEVSSDLVDFTIRIHNSKGLVEGLSFPPLTLCLLSLSWKSPLFLLPSFLKVPNSKLGNSWRFGGGDLVVENFEEGSYHSRI